MRTVTGLFDDYDDATAVVADLERLGVPPDQITLLVEMLPLHQTILIALLPKALPEGQG